MNLMMMMMMMMRCCVCSGTVTCSRRVPCVVRCPTAQCLMTSYLTSTTALLTPHEYVTHTYTHQRLLVCLSVSMIDLCRSCASRHTTEPVLVDPCNERQLQSLLVANSTHRMYQGCPQDVKSQDRDVEPSRPRQHRDVPKTSRDRSVAV